MASHHSGSCHVPCPSTESELLAVEHVVLLKLSSQYRQAFNQTLGEFFRPLNPIPRSPYKTQVPFQCPFAFPLDSSLLGKGPESYTPDISTTFLGALHVFLCNMLLHVLATNLGAYKSSCLGTSLHNPLNLGCSVFC